MKRLPLAASLACGLLIVLGCGLLSHCGGQPSHGAKAYQHTANIVALGPRPPESEPLAKTLGYLTESLAPHGWITQQRSFDSLTPKGAMGFTNLVARYAPAGEKEDTWTRPVKGLLCCHIDSKLYTNKVFVGADDAASAAGAILELAAWLAREHPERAAQLELVFFDGEEAILEDMTPRDGLYGSRRYAADWRRQPQKPAFGILLDMIGHKNLSIKLPSDTPPHLAELTFRMADEEKVQRHFRLGDIPIMDDHVPLNNVGIPTIDIIGDFASTNWWHTSRDNMDIISRESLDISIRVVRGMLLELLP